MPAAGALAVCMLQYLNGNAVIVQYSVVVQLVFIEQRAPSSVQKFFISVSRPWGSQGQMRTLAVDYILNPPWQSLPAQPRQIYWDTVFMPLHHVIQHLIQVMVHSVVTYTTQNVTYHSFGDVWHHWHVKLTRHMLCNTVYIPLDPYKGTTTPCWVVWNNHFWKL